MPNAEVRLIPIVYRQLHDLAARMMRREGLAHTVQPTAQVHEAYLKLTGRGGTGWQNRGHFFAFAAQVMRHLLVDYGRPPKTDKRPPSRSRMPLEDVVAYAGRQSMEMLDIDEALPLAA